MIEGLKVSVGGAELAKIANDRADYHAERAATYHVQIESMTAAKVEGMQYSGGDPVKALSDRRQQHEGDAAELRFIAAHIDHAETYLLDRPALHRLGIVASQY